MWVSFFLMDGRGPILLFKIKEKKKREVLGKPSLTDDQAGAEANIYIPVRSSTSRTFP